MRETLASFKIDKKHEIVLCHRQSPVYPFVTWEHNLSEEDDYYSGNYFRDRSEAVRDFLKRCESTIS